MIYHLGPTLTLAFGAPDSSRLPDPSGTPSNGLRTRTWARAEPLEHRQNRVRQPYRDRRRLVEITLERATQRVTQTASFGV
jgi:hypothetical protein